MIEKIIGDAGVEPMLKSWLMLDNHDTYRLATSVPDPTRRRLAQVLQFTLPGSPNIYYGTELGMSGRTYQPGHWLPAALAKLAASAAAGPS